MLPAVGTIGVFYMPPLIIAKIVDLISSEGSVSVSSVGGYIALFGGIWLFGEVLWRVGPHFLIKLEAKGLAELNNFAFTEILKRDYDFYTNNFVGTLTKRVVAFSRNFERFTDVLSFNIVNALFSIIFATIILWRYSFWIPVILLVCVTFTISIAIPIIKKRGKLVSEMHEAGSRLAGRFSDAMTNISAIKSFAAEKREESEYSKLVDEFSEKFKKEANYQNQRFDTVVSPLYVFTNLFGLIAAIFFIQRFSLPAGTLIVIFAYYGQVSRILWDSNRIYRNIESSISEAAEFTNMILEKPAIEDTHGAKELELSVAKIEFAEVGFSYGSSKKEQLFLEGFNLDIKSGQKVGLVGPSGGGKTTITKLLLRFLDLRKGKILIDDQNIAAVTQSSLREAIAFVPQEPLLFHRSLAENIAYSKEGASMDEIKNAARLARADEFIDVLPHGYDTLVGERGIKLSGGQRQRIAIARAIMKNAPILVLDEATSSLDSESEKFIQEGLWELMKGKTALVIAHRLSTIKHLDRILVLDKGKIVQDGTHDELIRVEGLYKKLWSHQSGEFLA